MSPESLSTEVTVPSSAPPSPWRNRLIVTVHGIRTLGGWQEELEAIARSPGSGIDNAQFRNVKFGFFSFITYAVPPLRFIKVKWFVKELEKLLERDSWDRIDIVAHSFGTHMTAYGLRHLIKKTPQLKIHTVILAGSVLKETFPWDDLIGRQIRRLVNECGIKDNVLVINQLFVPLSGSAGRFGFAGATHSRNCNRFYPVGHSGYFQADPPDYPEDNSFMRKY